MMVDLSLIPRDRQCAIWCQSAEEAEQFFAAMRRDYPEKCKAWGKGHNWSELFSCYNPNFLSSRDDGRMYYDRLAYYTEKGYEIIQFSEICSGKELHESEQSIELLFGLEV